MAESSYFKLRFWGGLSPGHVRKWRLDLNSYEIFLLNCRETYLSQRGDVLDYNEFELQFSKEGLNRYLASAPKDGEIAASQTFELRTVELKLILGLQRLEEGTIGPRSE